MLIHVWAQGTLTKIHPNHLLKIAEVLQFCSFTFQLFAVSNLNFFHLKCYCISNIFTHVYAYIIIHIHTCVINLVQNSHFWVHLWFTFPFSFRSQEQVVSERGLCRLQRGGGGDLSCTKVEGLVPATWWWMGTFHGFLMRMNGDLTSQDGDMISDMFLFFWGVWFWI